jgi:hypothetical protein
VAEVGDGALDPGDEGREERVRAEHARVAAEHEAVGERTASAERTGLGIRLPPEIACDVKNALPGLGRDAGPVVQREGHQTLAHPGAIGDIGYRQLATGH